MSFLSIFGSLILSSANAGYIRYFSSSRCQQLSVNVRFLLPVYDVGHSTGAFVGHIV